MTEAINVFVFFMFIFFVDCEVCVRLVICCSGLSCEVLFDSMLSSAVTCGCCVGLFPLFPPSFLGILCIALGLDFLLELYKRLVVFVGD